MSITKSQTEKIGSIFNGNSFIIPKYQRKYSWTNIERMALWDDIQESMSDNMNHFLGTLTFKEFKTEYFTIDKTYEVIDGQQRITTLFILLNSLIHKLHDENIKNELIRACIGINEPKIKLLGDDEQFFNTLIKNHIHINRNDIIKRSQRFLVKAKEEFDSLTNALSSENISNMIMFIRDRIEVLVFNVDDQVQAVKMFSIINDRGLPLSVLDKTKSALMMFSTLKLNNSLNEDINNSFESIYNSYDEIIEQKEILKILGRFEETTLFTHHYYSSRKLFSNIWTNRDAADTIFNNIKNKCEEYKNDDAQLSIFISSYINDFKDFCENYAGLIKTISKNDTYMKCFQFLEFSAILYPLIVRLFMQKKLDSLINILIAIEVRIYKLGKKSPIADIYWLSSSVAEKDLALEEIKNTLIWFNEKFMNDYSFKNYLDTDVYGNNAVKYILMEYNNENIDLDTYRFLQIEHIFSENTNFNVSDYGFSDDYDYEKDRIGNLLLLEQNINQSIQDSPPINKVEGYLGSSIQNTRNIGGKINDGGFDRSSIDIRTNEIIEFCLKKFKLSEKLLSI